jgi:hypothetical protein
MTKETIKERIKGIQDNVDDLINAFGVAHDDTLMKMAMQIHDQLNTVLSGIVMLGFEDSTLDDYKEYTKMDITEETIKMTAPHHF